MIRETLIVVAVILAVVCYGNSQDFTRVFTEEPVAAKTVSPANAVEIAAETLPWEVDVYTDKSCGPCESMHRRVGDGDADVHFNWIYKVPPPDYPQMWPLTTWTDAAGQRRFIRGPRTLDYIKRSIRDWNPPPRQVKSK